MNSTARELSLSAQRLQRTGLAQAPARGQTPNPQSTDHTPGFPSFHPGIRSGRLACPKRIAHIRRRGPPQPTPHAWRKAPVYSAVASSPWNIHAAAPSAAPVPHYAAPDSLTHTRCHLHCTVTCTKLSLASPAHTRPLRSRTRPLAPHCRSTRPDVLGESSWSLCHFLVVSHMPDRTCREHRALLCRPPSPSPLTPHPRLPKVAWPLTHTHGSHANVSHSQRLPRTPAAPTNHLRPELSPESCLAPLA